MTIAKWIDDGILPGHTTPGGHRRVAASDLVPFLRRHGMRVPSQLLRNDSVRVLAICRSESYLDDLTAAIERVVDGIEFRGVTRGIDGLVMVGEWHPQVVLLDLTLADVDGLQMCRSLAARDGDHAVRVVALSGDGADAERAALGAGAALCIPPERLLSEASGIITETVNGSGPVGSTGYQA